MKFKTTKVQIKKRYKHKYEDVKFHREKIKNIKWNENGVLLERVVYDKPIEVKKGDKITINFKMSL
jgi:hypothetical protein